MENEKVKHLAETLRKQGLAVSEYEAIEKAKSILNVSAPKSGSQEKGTSENPINDVKNQNIPLNKLMKEVNVTPEQVKAQEQEKLDVIETEVSDIKREIKQAEKNPEKTEQVKEEIAKVKEDINKIEEVKTEPQENKEQPEEDLFKEEKKVDLTKVFGNKK